MRFSINRYLIDDIENSEHPSSFEITDDYAILILRLPYIKSNHSIEIVSYAFLIKDDTIYKYNREKKDFYKMGGFEDLYSYLDTIIDKILFKVSKLYVDVSILEDLLYRDSFNKKFSKEWLNLKRDIALMARLMEHAIIAFELFNKHYRDTIDDRFAYNDLQEHLNRAYNLSNSSNDKLDYIYSFYRTKIDEKINSIMFILTIISAIFLPLGLITGFFGMNTGGLPFIDDSNGTIKAIIIATILEIPFIVLIWKMMRD